MKRPSFLRNPVEEVAGLCWNSWMRLVEKRKAISEAADYPDLRL